MTTLATRGRTRPTTTTTTALVALAAAALAMVISSLVPLTGPLLVALALGAVVANTRVSNAAALVGHARTTKTLLRLGVVLLGLRLPLTDVLDIGAGAIAVILVTVTVTYAATVRIGDRMGLDRDYVTLLAAGFSICGAAAIAAVDEVVRAKERLVALAVAMVTVFGSLMIVALPLLSRRLGLSQEQSAVWAGASIHEVAQVVAAASVFGGGAVALATTVKLGRVMLLAPMYAVASRRGTGDSQRRGAIVPWFVVGFAVTMALRSTGVIDPQALRLAELATTLLLSAGMFGLGLGIRVRELWPVPARDLALAALSTAVAAGVSLVLVLVLI